MQFGNRPSPLDYSGGLLTDNAGPFSRTSPPVLFQDTPLAGSEPSIEQIMRYWAQRSPSPQYNWLLENDKPI